MDAAGTRRRGLSEPQWRTGLPGTTKTDPTCNGARRPSIVVALPCPQFLAVVPSASVPLPPWLVCLSDPPVRPPAFFLPCVCFVGVMELGALDCTKRAPQRCLLAVPSYSFPISPSFPASQRVPSSPAALSLQLLARGPGGSRNLKRMRTRVAATSSHPAGQRLRGLGGGAGWDGAGRRDLRVSGADVAQWDLRTAAAAARWARRGGAKRQLLASPGGREGSRCPGCCIPKGVVSAPPWPPSPPIAPRARVRCWPWQPPPPRLADRASCIMCGKEPRAGGVLPGGAGVRCGRCWGLRRRRERRVEDAKSGWWAGGVPLWLRVLGAGAGL